MYHRPRPGDHPRNSHYPNPVGRPSAHIRQQLELFKRRSRGGTSYHHIMQRVAAGLSEDDTRAVAAFFASLADAASR